MRLRKTLLELVLLAAVPACSGGGHSEIDANPNDPFDPCSTLTKVEPEPPSSALRDLVRMCEADTAKCQQLCQRILEDEGFGSHSITDCTVTHTLTSHTIKVGHCLVVVEGRRPAGLVGARRACLDIAGGHLARAAFYEAASIHAFVQLARELRRHRAPRTLVAGARRSAAEEIQHARIMTALAHARGATPPPLAVAAPRRRSIESLAIENACEGLVGETWSAMLAAWQSLHAPAPLRAAYARIADDELRHAELAVEIDDWAKSRLSRAANKRVAAARTRAIAQLSRHVRRAPHHALVTELGLPDRAASSRLFDTTRERLWA